MSESAQLAVDERAIRVVVVDDHLLVADSVAATLVAAGIDVVGVAGSCADGIEAVRRAGPDVLLLDQGLPDGLGTDALPLLFAACPTMSVLLVTAMTCDEVVLRAFERGCTGVVRKGARASELVAAVRAATRDEAVISADDLRRLLPRIGAAAPASVELTARERAVLHLLVEGTSTLGISQALSIAVATARNHVQGVMGKLGAHSRLEAVAIAVRENIVVRP